MPETFNRRELAQELLQLTTAEWGERLKGLTSSELSELEREVDQIAMNAGYLSGYLSARGADGCSDEGHQVGVQAGRIRQTKIKRALGYNV